MTQPGNTEGAMIRTLFCFGVLPAFFEVDKATRKQVFDTLVTAYSDLEGRFGVKVLATMDDDMVMVGPSTTYPWTCYILADVPNYNAITQVCNILREFSVGDDLIWRYMKVEARPGRALFFGNA